MSDAGEISWDFDIKKEIAFHVGYGANKFFRTINAFEMFWHAEGMKSVFSGTITLNGEKYILKPETCNGYSDKNLKTAFSRLAVEGPRSFSWHLTESFWASSTTKVRTMTLTLPSSGPYPGPSLTAEKRLMRYIGMLSRLREMPSLKLRSDAKRARCLT